MARRQSLASLTPIIVVIIVACLTVCAALPVLGTRGVMRRMRARESMAMMASTTPEQEEFVLRSLSPDDSFDAFTPGPEIWVGSIVALVPIVWATIEFTSRIRTQQQCLVCSGSGLVYATKQGNPLARARKCYNCGGFLPWLGWRRFFLSTFDVGNGGVLQRPSRDYEATNAAFREGRAPVPADEEENEAN